mmetsp:Transcript_104127/g.335737  ORF Transcript_104127/g.335737 Transcript_104127/m.335737 type:complete len:242 (-) Transcript_104127:881-1606(-)
MGRPRGGRCRQGLPDLPLHLRRLDMHLLLLQQRRTHGLRWQLYDPHRHSRRVRRVPLQLALQILSSSSFKLLLLHLMHRAGLRELLSRLPGFGLQHLLHVALLLPGLCNLCLHCVRLHDVRLHDLHMGLDAMQLRRVCQRSLRAHCLRWRRLRLHRLCLCGLHEDGRQLCPPLPRRRRHSLRWRQLHLHGLGLHDLRLGLCLPVLLVRRLSHVPGLLNCLHLHQLLSLRGRMRKLRRLHVP